MSAQSLGFRCQPKLSVRCQRWHKNSPLRPLISPAPEAPEPPEHRRACHGRPARRPGVFRASLDAAEAAGVFTYKTVEQGAATSIVAAVAPEFAHSGGHYLDDSQEAYTVPDDAGLAQHPHGVKEWALDPTAAKRLWTVSTDLLRV
ncbi:hypothetical protein [Nonomuraea aurantiaca]|uniref:hypothetical protein n=1 Tax=Nonomuraea aurantiaca TaxID=2878562 RepID=UPI001CDA482C|nr:hypothetical protein [Nonomuraea aurantiaca]MCA2223568.1 hypothetical protein [Nonomuraea aurantiaca]